MDRLYSICHMTTSLVNKADVAKLQPIIYDLTNHHLVALGKKVG